jgi:hypothetical protein
MATNASRFRISVGKHKSLVCSCYNVASSYYLVIFALHSIVFVAIVVVVLTMALVSGA